MSALRVFVLLGAFLLFAMEPMVGRLLLPDFGGAFHVWTTSLMFFQAALFVGYLYAHLGAERAGRTHLALLALPVVLLPPTVRVVGEGGEVGSLLATLAIDFGLPFAALATTGVVSQHWLARSSLPERDRPYVLYAWSNVGSLIALLAYALLIEPLVGLTVQRWTWAVGYLGYLAVAFVAFRATRRSTPARVEALVDEPPPEPIQWTRIGYWLALSACPSIFLMAVTNLIALDAGNVPLVWVVPLAIYLLTFVLAFAEPSRVPELVRRLWPHFGAVGMFFFAGADTGGSWSLAILQLFVLFAVCAAAHAELHASRPAPSRLTLFYLVVSLGGWLGGAFVALLAPSLFRGLYEYPIAIVGLALAMAAMHRRALWDWIRGPGKVAVGVTLLLVAAIAWRVASGIASSQPSVVRTLEVQRSFYGLYYVIERATVRGRQRALVSGTTGHGRQFLDPALRGEPLSYYHRRGPLGDAMVILHERTPHPRIGIVGLGVGATAAYAGEGDAIDFFEIDPVVVELARRHFSYLSDSPGEVRTIVGDARLELARVAREEPGRRYDLLLIDAFAGDAIPTHLVTREATELDRSLLAEDGILLFHVSNRYYDLRPVLARTAGVLGLHAATKYQPAPANDPEGLDPSQYVVMVEREELLAPFLERGFTRLPPGDGPLWTDDHASAITALMPDWE